MRIIEYIALDCHGPDFPGKLPLEAFVFEVPHFGACGVFPPLKVLNQMFDLGTMGGGMSPGARWSPFSISEDEYQELLGMVLEPPSESSICTRRPWQCFIVDNDFDVYTTLDAWRTAACGRYRERWHEFLRTWLR